MYNAISKLLVISAFLASSVASAADINRTSSLQFVDNTTTFSGLFSSADAGKSFSDNFTFSVGSQFDTDSAVITIATGNSNQLAISGFTLTGPGSTTFGSKILAGGTSAWSLMASDLSAGTYTLSVLGSVMGSHGGSFGGNINVASAVPEASTYLMLLTGLGLVGIMAYRRKTIGVDYSDRSAKMA